VVEATIPELQAAMSRGRTNAVGLVDAYLARIEAYDRRGPKLNSVIRLNPDARADAAGLDAERAAGHVRGPLHGIPVLIKDNYDTRDMPTSGGSVALAGFVPGDEAFVVQKLRAAGAVILGKTNMHELASGTTTISSLGGQTLNPYDPERSPGGSSGGSAAASAASLAAVTYGTDTCGSLRLPAAFNGLFALRPTQGLVSTSGIIPLSHSQDVAGPLARSVTDLAIGLDAVVGPNPTDTQANGLQGRPPPDFVGSLDTAALHGIRLGIIRADGDTAPEEVEGIEVIKAAIEQMRAHGAEIVDVRLPLPDSAIGHASVTDFEFKYDLIDYLAREPNAPVRSLTEILAKGLYASALEGRFRHRDSTGTRDSETYLAALTRRRTVHDAIVEVLESQHLDVLLYPTTRRAPARLGEPTPGTESCLLSAVSGLPALAAPAGYTARGLPIGFELLGRPLADRRLVAIAYAYEQAVHPRRPPPTTPPLVRGRPPAPVAFVAFAGATGGARARATFAVDSARGTMRYQVRISGLAPQQVFAAVLSRAAEDGTRRVIRRLSAPGSTRATGALSLTADERADLFAGRLSLILFSAIDRLGTAPAVVVRRPPRVRVRAA